MKPMLTSLYIATSAESEDGYIRLEFPALQTLRFDRHLAWFDEDLRGDLEEANVPAIRAGYCEWVNTDMSPHVSLGWAWFKL